MQFMQPTNLLEALRWGQGPGAKYLAGGTDLILQMRTGQAKPEVLVDLTSVEELKELRIENGMLKIGSMVTFGEIERSEFVQEKATALYQACLTMGSPQIHNQATLGGNLGNCSPAADSLPPLLALGAQIKLCTLKNQEAIQEEQVLLSEFLKRDVLLEQGTLIRGFEIPLKGTFSAFAKLGRRDALAIARLSIAIALQLEGTFIQEIEVALGAVGKRAFLIESLNASLKNKPFDENWIKLAVGEVQNMVKTSLGTRASAAYKRVAVGGVMREVLSKLSVVGEIALVENNA